MRGKDRIDMKKLLGWVKRIFGKDVVQITSRRVEKENAAILSRREKSERHGALAKKLCQQLYLLAARKGTLVGTSEHFHCYGGSGGRYQAQEYVMPVATGIVGRVTYHFNSSTSALEIGQESIKLGNDFFTGEEGSVMEVATKALTPMVNKVRAEIRLEEDARDRAYRAQRESEENRRKKREVARAETLRKAAQQ